MRTTRTFVQAGWMALGLALGACSKEDSTLQEEAKSTATAPAATAPATVATVIAPSTAPATSATTATPEDVLEVRIGTVGEQMAYDLTAIKAKTGQRVHIVLKNNGHAAIMPHNWVLVTPGKQADVALAGVDKKADGYLVPGPNVLASTPLAEPQATAETTFTAPAPGEYPYLCTVPGHYMLMKGILTVTP